MSKECITNKLHSTIDNLACFIENFSGNEICIAEYDINGTSYLLKDIDLTSEVCSIEVRRSQGKVVELIRFDHNKVFAIYNSTEICFIPIDGKGLLKTGYCDFVFFNDQDFCFVEMKLNATSIDERTIEDNRKKAVKQLKHTIAYFDKQLSNNYFGLILKAYVATPDIYPQEDTSFQSIKVNFLEETGIDLYESREKRY